MSSVNGSLDGYNLYYYCFNNPIMYTDHTGNWPEWVENAVNWVEAKYDKWKEESFVYNVALKNVSIDVGVGFGIGGELEIGSAKISGITRVDVIGVEINGFETKWGHHGKSSLGVGYGKASIGAESKTYESFDGTKVERNKKSIPEIAFSGGGEVGFGFAIHGGFSVSISGIYRSLVDYGKKNEWW